MHTCFHCISNIRLYGTSQVVYFFSSKIHLWRCMPWRDLQHRVSVTSKLSIPLHKRSSSIHFFFNYNQLRVREFAFNTTQTHDFVSSRVRSFKLRPFTKELQRDISFPSRDFNKQPTSIMQTHPWHPCPIVQRETNSCHRFPWTSDTCLY